MKKGFKILVLVLVLIMGLVGCGKKGETAITDYNGVYKKGKNVFYVVATDDENFKYYVTDEYDNKNYGTLEYRNGVAINDDFDEVVKLELKGNKLKVTTKNITNFSSGIYKRTGDLTIDEYYNDNYGRNDYYGNEYTGKFINTDGTIYMYQPVKKYVSFIADINDEITSCEINIEEQGGLVCDIVGTIYTVKLDGNKLTYTKDSSEEENYSGEFIREGELSKQEIINKFDPFYAFGDE